MKLNKDLWSRILKIELEFKRREDQLSISKIEDIFQVSNMVARQIQFALNNRDVIGFAPDVIPYKKERVLAMADLHIPYQHELSIDTMLDFAQKYNPTIIVILGDLIDFFKISRFTEAKMPGKKSVKQEMICAKKFLDKIRALFPDAKIIYYQGNHELRLERFILKNASEIYELIENLIPITLDLPGLGIEYKTRPFAIGKLWYLHGHEKPAGGNPEWVTNVIFKYVLDHFICGHYHRDQKNSYKRIDGTVFVGMSLGYLAQEMEYAILNKWSRSFATIDYNEKGFFKMQGYKIINGEIY